MADKGSTQAAPDTTAAAFTDGMALALWLHSQVNPQLKRWGKSGDRRVRLMAAVISDLVADAYIRQDWDYLNHMYDVWQKNDRDQKPPPAETMGGTPLVDGDDKAPF